MGYHVAECNVYYLMGRIHKQLGHKRDAIHYFTLAQDHLSSKSSTLIKEAIGIFFLVAFNRYCRKSGRLRGIDAR